MQPNYEIYEVPTTGEKVIKRITEHEIAYIPMDQSNADYRQYLKDLEKDVE